MKKNVFIIFLSILCTGAVVEHPHLNSSVPINEIINCLSRSIHESGYIMDLNGTRLPINAKEFATYKMSNFSGSFWIEYSTEGRPIRETGIKDATQESYKVLNDALRLCSETLTRYWRSQSMCLKTTLYISTSQFSEIAEHKSRLNISSPTVRWRRSFRIYLWITEAKNRISAGLY